METGCYYADGRFEPITERLTLAQLQAYVGGLIEQVSIPGTRKPCWVNEEGLLMGLPRNATFPQYVGNVLYGVSGK